MERQLLEALYHWLRPPGFLGHPLGKLAQDLCLVFAAYGLHHEPPLENALRAGTSEGGPPGIPTRASDAARE